MQLRLANQPITSLAVLSAITYNSWPLGYLLNNHVARTGLFSDLEAVGQPYRLLFIILDIVTALLVVIMAGLAYYHNRQSRAARLLGVGWLMFAGGTLIDAVLPLHCSSISWCNLEANQIIDSHNILGFIAMMGLFMAYLASSNPHNKKPNLKLHLAFGLWALAGLAYLLVVTISNHGNVAQAVFLVMAGLLLAAEARTSEAYFADQKT